MNTVTQILMGLIAGYVIGIVVTASFAFVLDLDDIARFIAIGSGLVGALAGPRVFGGLLDQQR